MTKTSQFVLCTGVVILAAIAGAGRGIHAAPQSTDDAPTFTRDVAPILYANCVTCHRSGEIAPMSLISYQEVRPWARAMTKQISDGAMPPWHADAPTGTFSNERKLTAAEKATIEHWAAAGAPEGDPSDLKPPPTFAQGWRIGTPDVIFEMDEDYPIPARGTVEYEHFYIPTNFAEAKWLKGIEVRGADCVPLPLAMGFVALWKGLFYDDGAMDAALQLAQRFAEAGSTQERFDTACRRGLAGEVGGRRLASWAEQVIELADGGLSRLAPEDRRWLLPLSHQIATGKSPGQTLLEKLGDRPDPADLLESVSMLG